LILLYNFYVSEFARHFLIKKEDIAMISYQFVPQKLKILTRFLKNKDFWYGSG